ncbi:malonate decarboxylase holo-ACP synthase [Janthinobacterium lividum]|uniref:Malonate decarboxylase holo-ACP synthase n=1 Tax=Janthinobacterium lividum TaxID=29581 RepID=A0ABU0XLN4_9BURK|nr:malonate decarboxylase holo-ACP synthase [Janthinobacterium lividum]MDQ4624436.1 malonate decarboxylase holo-ACP synthase [Janthinobacterium lividum]MDQ4673960.1 malonate decarboxylase holo-ACP synthase [Janthinobacterium lividum]MDQ4684690.1 malonate decarboxylase holo-ACP synthase [Janthinobacterium lividum]
MEAWRAHDLLWLDGPPDGASLPAWCDAVWLQAAPLVVRRASSAPGRIPVGLRGRLRSERHGFEIDAAAVVRRVAPEMLAHVPLPGVSCAALDALREVAPLLDATGWAWGPTGGVGFALASGLPVLRADSDLDLVLRIAAPPDAAQAGALRTIAATVTACRLDLQIDTGSGGFAYAEWAAGRGKVLLKTDHGPVLTATPWEMA